MARLPYIDAEQLPPEQRDLLKRPINLTRLLVNSPGMAKAFHGIGGYIRSKSTLDSVPTARVSPSGEKARAKTYLAPQAMRTRPTSRARSHSQTLPSSPALASQRPSGENVTALTQSLCPSRTIIDESR